MNIDSKLFLAPMAGYTDLPFRLLARENGADITLTEMISAKGLYYRDKKTRALFRSDVDETDFGIQIFGSEPQILSEAVKILLGEREELGFSFIDFNAGCPAPKIVKNGDGSALLKNPLLLAECINSISKAAEGVPVSVKTRIGFEEGENLLETVVPVIEESGADFLTIHPRTRSQFYSGKSDWDTVSKIVEKVDIPVVLSGDIISPESAKEAYDTGVNALMIGRAALVNPYIFTQIKDYLAHGTYKELTLERKLDIINRHLDLALKYKTNERVVVELRKQLANYTKGLPEASKLRREIFQTQDIETVRTLFENLRRN